MKLITSLLALIVIFQIDAQYALNGKIQNKGESIPYAKVKINTLKAYAMSDSSGNFTLRNLPIGKFEIEVIAYGFATYKDSIQIPHDYIFIELKSSELELEEVVISGTLKEVSKKESTVNVEVFTPKFFKKNPTPSVFDALQNVNGVRPQLNCNICNTGDIHINGLEGPYTMVLIDGMPIVSSLSTVYGLSGIPNSLVDRIEIVKGPASTLYGSEAIGGIINIITKNPSKGPRFSVDIFSTSWFENSADLSFQNRFKEKATSLTGINYYYYGLKKDDNRDGFTDVTLQNRISVFQKWNFNRRDHKLFSLAGRYLYENRWGGETDWTTEFRGTDSVYGESIYTSRWEIIGTYQLPVKEKIFTTFSFNDHIQDSYYGNISFQASQFIGFGQMYWDKKIGRHDMILGGAMRYTNYNDDTPATETNEGEYYQDQPSITWLPGIYVQDEISLNEKHKLLTGLRFDYNSLHGSIFTPRLGYKWSINQNNILRLNTGTGYRVVNIYTEDHAALTGAREVVIEDNIAPETSYNANLNYSSTLISKKKKFVNIDFTAFYTYFDNKIFADYDTDPNKIYYSNLSAFAVSQGVSLGITMNLIRNLTINTGGTLMDVANYESGVKKQQILTEKFSGNWSVSYEFQKAKFSVDYTGNVYSPMRLPLLSENDPRPDTSPWWSIQNIQISYKGFKNWEIYGGVKNLLNWTPNKNSPFLIARSHDPFDKKVHFDSNNVAQITAENPYGLTFDPTYVYAPNQGIRGFIGVRYILK